MCATAGFRGVASLDLSLAQAYNLNKSRVEPLKRLKRVSDLYAVNIVDTSHKVRNQNIGWGQAAASIASAKSEIAAAWQAYTGRSLEPGERAIVAELVPLMERADASIQKLESIVKRRDYEALRSYTVKEMYPVIDPVTEKVGALVDYALRQARADYERVAAHAKTERAMLIGLVLLSIASAIGLGLLLRSAITGPVLGAAVVVRSAAMGDLTKSIEARSGDEVGKMTLDLGQFLSTLRTNIGAIVESTHQLSAASHSLNGISHQMASSSEETATQANVVSAAGEQVAQNLGVVVTGSSQMVASIREISHSANECARVAAEAVQTVDAASANIGNLRVSSAEIGKVIRMITSIAEQTNLLALNATIEAARAGESGKGFAVVANEVKELAKETAKATELVSARIEAIQKDTSTAIDAVESISKIITQVNSISGTIASAVEEQTATTNEMARNLSEASRGAEDIARNITGVAEASRTVSQGALDTQKSASDLSHLASSLENLVQQYQY